MYLRPVWRILDRMHSGGIWRLGHRPALDGLRGIAILLVVVAHAAPDAGIAPGGLGVTMFFALSGFLITSLLLEEHAARGRVSFAGFYKRRVRRLMPALVVYLAVWFTLSVLGIGFVVEFGEVLVALFYMTNWQMAAWGAAQPIGITWSLSIEEQFYLLWPLTFLLAKRWPRLPMVVALAGITYSLGLRAVLWSAGASSWSLYYRSDARMDSILIGCLFAIAVHRGFRPAQRWLTPLGLLVLAVFLYGHGMTLQVVGEPFLVPVATCAIIASVLAGRSRWLEQPVLRWFGRRSYALYLWHYPLAALAWKGEMPMWFAIGLALALAETSWWLVERPFSKRRSGHTRHAAEELPRRDVLGRGPVGGVEEPDVGRGHRLREGRSAEDPADAVDREVSAPGVRSGHH